MGSPVSTGTGTCENNVDALNASASKDRTSKFLIDPPFMPTVDACNIKNGLNGSYFLLRIAG